MSPARPLYILSILIFAFSLFYMWVMARPSTAASIWRVWDDEKDQPEHKPERVRIRDCRLPLYALWFSTLSAFLIGWRELNVGTWLTRLNPHEFNLKGSGWVRTVSGIQSVISVYLLALAVLTYFGRPFE